MKEPEVKNEGETMELELDVSRSKNLLEDKEEIIKVLLADTKSRTLFLTKTGVIFIIYATAILLVCYLVTYDMPRARTFYKDYNLKDTTIYCLAAITIIKLLFLLIGWLVRGLSIFLFVVDAALSMVAFLGLFFYYDHFVKTQYIWSGHYVIIVGVNVFATSVGFMISTLKRDDVKIYDYILGTVIMFVFNIIACLLLSKSMNVIGMKNGAYIKIALIFLVVDLFMAINSYQIVNYRTKKFYEYEYIYCFFTYWTDWFSFFWIDIFSSNEEAKRDYLIRKHQHQKFLEEKIKPKREEEVPVPPPADEDQEI